MKKIFLSTQIPNDKTAASKAKVDVLEIMKSIGYQIIYFPKIQRLTDLFTFWKILSRAVEKDTHLVLEYPCWPRKRMWIISTFSYLNRIKLYGVIHDIGDLRFPEAEQKSDMYFLKRFDGLVSHNASMTDWLRKKGYKKKIIELEAFDYLLDAPKSFHESSLSNKLRVLYAGNLSYTKATYIYDRKLDYLDNIQIDVYGQAFEKERINGSAVSYKGVFSPDFPELSEKYHFGLIWEGISLDTCKGQYGEYIRFNNPHKFSLYISLGLPVIVWKEAAISLFVKKNNIGLTIGSFNEIEKISETVTPSQYDEYVKNVKLLGDKLRNGFFLKSAIARLINE